MRASIPYFATGYGIENENKSRPLVMSSFVGLLRFPLSFIHVGLLDNMYEVISQLESDRWVIYGCCHITYDLTQ